MSTETTWLLEHAEVTTAASDFVWDYWTDVKHWDDQVSAGRPLRLRLSRNHRAPGP